MKIGLKSKLLALGAVPLAFIIFLSLFCWHNKEKLNEASNSIVTGQFLPLVNSDIPKLTDEYQAGLGLLSAMEEEIYKTVIIEKNSFYSTSDELSNSAASHAEHIGLSEEKLAQLRKILERIGAGAGKSDPKPASGKTESATIPQLA